MSSSQSVQATEQVQTPQWELKWAEEFDTEGAPDPAKWTYEDGFVRNNELQLYTNRRENSRIENGVLVIEGRKEKMANPNFKAGSTSWQEKEFATHTSAAVTTQGRQSFLYGRIEVRAKLPQGKGVWPAIWTLGDNITQIGWPRCGEIDIMEFVGKEPNHVHGTTHFSVEGKHASSGKALDVDKPFDEFHIYAVEWTSERIEFFFDQTKVHSFDIKDAGANADEAFRKPHYLLLNLALGGDWGGEMDDSALPQKFLVDYVRYYQDKNAK